MRISDWSSDVCSSDLPVSGQFVVHVDGNYRNSGDMRVGGLIYAEPLREHLLSLASDAADTGDAAEAERLTSAANSRRSEEHTSELQSLMRISYAVFCLQKQKQHP